MTLTTAQLFDDIPTDSISVAKTTFLILKEHWKPLFLLTGVQFAVLLGVVLILGLVTFGLAATYILALFAVMKNNMPSDGYGRYLVDYSVGFSGTSRLLEQAHDGGYYNNDLPDMFDAKFFLTIAAIYIMWLVVCSLVMSIFTGAYIHIVADIYSGNEPTVSKSIRHGRDRMWSIFIFTFLIGFIVIVSGLVTIAVPIVVTFKNNPDDPNFGAIALGVMVFSGVLVALTLYLTAVPPVIVVENRSPSEAMKRSYNLCKNFLCFIFAARFWYSIVMTASTILFGQFLNVLPTFLAFIGHVFINLVTTAALPIYLFVLYMSMRIRMERITQEDISLEIGNHIPIADAVEMPLKSSNDDKGAYNNISKQEVV